MDPMRCVFHRRTRANADAPALLPLSTMEHEAPDAYRAALAKYQDTPERRRLPATRIPGIDASWIDVVFLSPIHPHALWSAWRDARGTALPAAKFWAIPAADLEGAVVLDRRISRTGEPIAPEEVTPFDPSAYRASSETTAGNRQWLRDCAAHGDLKGLFHRTPHVLVPGPVALRNAWRLDWSLG